MIVAAHQTMMANAAVVAPTQFRYLGLKVCACRFTRQAASLSALRNMSGFMTQVSGVEFLTSSSSMFAWPSGMTISNYTAYNGERHYSEPTLVSNYNSGEGVGRLFDNNKSTKFGAYNLIGFSATYARVFDSDTGDVLMQSGGTYDVTFINQHFGTKDHVAPAALVLDLGASNIDISVYPTWRFLNANDNASQTGRTWIEGEILGSNDMTTWWRLDVFNDTSIPNTNYAVAYTGNLVARPGDIWFGLDLATRDWTNGIATD